MKKLFLFLMPLALIGCSTNDDKPTIEPPDPPMIGFRPGMYNFVKTNNSFGDKMMLKLCTDVSNKNQNVTFSPYSMNMLMSMIINGASDEPQKEILNVMGMDKYGIDSLNLYNNELSEIIQRYAGAAKLELANAAWIQNGLTVKDSFTNTMKNLYSADVKNIDFSQTEAAQNTINNWCNEKTNGMIKKTSLVVTPDMRSVLANATYFKGEWKQKFNKGLTHKAVFNNQSGTKGEVDMMTTEDYFVYTKTKDYESVEYMQYAGSSLSMNLVLPAEGVDVDSLIGKVNLSNQSMPLVKVNLTMPKLKIENHWKDFDNTLKTLGINKVMISGDQMNRIAEDLFVSKIVQDVAVDVNEDGTEAAAVSTGGIATTSFNPNEMATINFNRPFLFYIKESATGAILFMGKIANL